MEAADIQFRTAALGGLQNSTASIAGGVESGSEELYIGKHVRSRAVEYAGECVRHLAVESDESASRSKSRRRATENDTSTEYVKSQKTGAVSSWIRSDCTVWFMTK